MILVQINFDFSVEMMGNNLVQGATVLAESINLESGFISKIWIENSQTKESGGIYLFDSQSNAERYVAMHTPRVIALGAKNLTVKYFEVNSVLSEINHFSLRGA